MSAPTRQYYIETVLGRGAFGTVYRARFEGERGFSKQVALKVLNAQVLDIEEVARRLRDEARMMGLLRHRAIIGADRLACLGGRWAVVMEYVEGADLGRIVQDERIPLGPALEIVGEVAGALDAGLHTPGPDGRPLQVVHRDLKPSNLMLTGYGEVKILDFGGARADFGEREAETRNFTIGSLAYMAPERLDFRDSPASDVYSLGAILYELVVGERFGRTSMDRERHMNKLGPALETFASRLPQRDPEPVYLLAAMLAHDDAKRPSAREVERGCLDLAQHFGRTRLRSWADQVVPPILAAPSAPIPDELTGSLLQEQRDERSVVLTSPTATVPLQEGALYTDSEAPGSTSAERAVATPPVSATESDILAVQSQSLVGGSHASPSEIVAATAPSGSRWLTAFLLLTVLVLSAILALMVIRERLDTAPAAEVEQPDPASEDQPAIQAPTETVTPAPTPATQQPAAPATARPQPEPAADTPLCRVQATGDADQVRLVSEQASGTLPSSLPTGGYAIRASFGGGALITAGSVMLESSAPVTIHCSSRFQRCAVK